MKRLKMYLAMLILGAAWPVTVSAARPAFQADPNYYLNDLVREMELAWPRNRIINLVFHGHSVPAGYAKTPVVDTFNAYPHLLHVALKERFPNAQINVIVTAKGGEASDEGVARFERDVLVHKPDVVFIDYGLNDRRLERKEARDAWAIMIAKAKERDARVVLLTPTPELSTDLTNPEDALYKQAQRIRRWAYMNEVGLADSYKAFSQYVKQGGKLEDLMSQVNHPNRKGHELVAAELLRWFTPKRPSVPEPGAESNSQVPLKTESDPEAASEPQSQAQPEEN